MPFDGLLRDLGLAAKAPPEPGLELSPGLDLGTPLPFAPDLPSRLEGALRRSASLRPVALGLGADPYQPPERAAHLTREVLQTLERLGRPLNLVTSRAEVVQDLPILRRLAGRGLVQVWLSLPTLDLSLARGLEPRGAAPLSRLQAIAALAQAAIPAGVLVAPLIAGVNDAELERILAAAGRAGARHAGYAQLHLPPELRDAVTPWLDRHVPGHARRTLALIRERRTEALARPGGRLPEGADTLAQRLGRAARQLGLTTSPDFPRELPSAAASPRRELADA